MGLAISKCLNRKKRSVIFIGPPGCGKTSLIKILKKDKTEVSGSTNLYEQSTVRGKGYALEIFDLSGDQKQAQFWKFYSENCHLVVFVVDISAPEKITASREVFKTFYTSYCIHKESLVFLLNQQDLVPAEQLPERVKMFHEEFGSVFGTAKQAKLKVLPTSSASERSKLLAFLCKSLD